MLEFFVIVVALSLLGAIIYGLHKHQTMEVEYTVDRTMPLPPINGGLKNPHLEESSFFRSSHSTTQTRDARQAEQATSGISIEEKQQNDESWQDQVASAKQDGDFDRATQLCRQQFPLWSAYNQACIALRAKLKLELDTEQQNAALNELYRIAVIAELLHDKSDGATRYTLSQLRKLDHSGFDAWEIPYSEIGYAQLRLIRKSDVKLMLTAWNRPAQHQLPRQALAQAWSEIAAGL